MREDLDLMLASAPEFYHGYLRQIPMGEWADLMPEQGDELASIFMQLPVERHDWAYAPGKWTAKEVLGHIIDAERIFQYRLLRIARGDKTPLAGFDENQYVPEGRFHLRNLETLVDEFTTVRHATSSLVASMDSLAWQRDGIANEKPVSARALVGIIYGHAAHHLSVFQERYLSKSES